MLDQNIENTSITSALIENKRLKHEISVIEEKTKLKMEKHLKYRLGNIIVQNSKRLIDFFKIPYLLIREYKKYKYEQEHKRKLKTIQYDGSPIISVIIAAYNCEKYIKQCIDSLLKQSFKNFEIIVVDDGSTDSTYNILKEYSKKINNIFIYRQQNKFAGEARNNGLSHAKGKYVLFLDADDFFEPNMLMRCYLRATDLDAEIVIFRGREYNDQTKEFSGCKFPVSPELFPSKAICCAEDFGEKLFQANSCIAWNKLIRKSLIDQVGVKFATTKSSNDTVFIYTLLSKAKRITLLDEIFVNYRIGNPNSLQRSKSQSWECICLAFFQLKKKLIEIGKYEGLKRSYINKALQANLYYLSTVDEKTRPIMECALNNKYFKLLDILENADKKGYIYNKNFQKKYLEIKTKKYIPIVYATDNNYAKHVSVSIQSIIENSNSLNYLIFFILVDSGFDEQNKQLLREQVNRSGHSIEFINMKEAFKDAKTSIAHISYHTFYRLQLPKILSYLNKLIYIDADTIVLKDIATLYDNDIRDSYFGGVKALAFDNKKHKNRLGIDTDKYINAGVLLVNNRLLIKDNLLVKFNELVKHEYDCQDQDIINIAAYRKIKTLPTKFNLMTKYKNDYERFIKENKISQKEYNEAISDPTIIHYADKIKPWDDKSSWLAAHYWKYAKKTPFYIEERATKC